MGDEENVKGGKEIAALAEKGMALFAAEKGDEVELDVDAATQFKADHEAKIAAIEAEAAALTGKDNKKARTEKSKEASAMKNDKQYIDAQKVVKGLEPKNGFFTKSKAAAKPKAAAAAETKVEEKAERDELEKLKNDIISRKKELKESGMSGGQINKDEQVAGWVARMNELKEKENPGCLTAAKEDKKEGKKKKLSAEQEAEKKNLEQQIEEYRNKLKTEFGYTNKDIKADPDLNDMIAKLNGMK